MAVVAELGQQFAELLVMTDLGPQFAKLLVVADLGPHSLPKWLLWLI